MLSSDAGREARIFVTQLRSFWLQQLKLLKVILIVRILDYLNFVLPCVKKECQGVEGNLYG